MLRNLPLIIWGEYIFNHQSGKHSKHFQSRTDKWSVKMDQLCSMLDVMFNPEHLEHNYTSSGHPGVDPEGFNTSLYNTTGEHSNSSDLITYHMDLHNRTTSEALRFYIITVIIPFCCIVGILGNACNILVVSKQRSQAPMDKSAYAVLIGLYMSSLWS